ncbi:MAG: lysylphosphatidylglycerol synthase transmembrane domain-containing protein [Terracidiphilus sp.]
MSKRQLILGLVLLAALVALAFYAQHRHPINWHEVIEQFALAKWSYFGIGLGCIYFAYIFRATRWAYLLRHHQKVNPLSLVGSQVMGFTAVALIGRVADPVRPYLTAKKTGLSIANQLAVYVVERLFDFGTMAVFFSVAMIVIFRDQNASSSLLVQSTHSGFLAKFAGPRIAQYGGLVLTLFGVLFLVLVRLLGSTVAVIMDKSLSLISKNLGRIVGEKILSFQAGLDTIRTIPDFLIAAGTSVGMWTIIAFAYFITLRGFTGSHELSTIRFSQTVVLMMISGGASVLQLPILGWFTQIFAVAAVLANGFQVSAEASMACAATLLLVTFIGVIPIGLVWAQFDHISLRKVTHESEEEAEHISADPPPAAANSESV